MSETMNDGRIVRILINMNLSNYSGQPNTWTKKVLQKFVREGKYMGSDSGVLCDLDGTVVGSFGMEFPNNPDERIQD